MLYDHYDLIIIGAGPGGLTAGIYAARRGLKTLLLDKALPGGCINDAAIIENYPGFPLGISGQDLASRMSEHCANAGAEIHIIENVIDLALEEEKKLVTTDKGIYSCEAVIIATGTKYNKLGIPKEEELRGRGISYCAVCDGPLFKNKKLLVVGGGNSAAIDAIYLADLASSVTLIHRRNTLRAENALIEKMKKKDIKILFNAEVENFKGDDRLRGVILRNTKTGDLSEMDIEGAFINVGRIPNSDFVNKVGIKLDKGYIVVDQRQRTNIEGIFAVGDVTSCFHKQAGKAVGDAVVAANEAYGYIKNPYFHRK